MKRIADLLSEEKSRTKECDLSLAGIKHLNIFRRLILIIHKSKNLIQNWLTHFPLLFI